MSSPAMPEPVADIQVQAVQSRGESYKSVELSDDEIADFLGDELEAEQRKGRKKRRRS